MSEEKAPYNTSPEASQATLHFYRGYISAKQAIAADLMGAAKSRFAQAEDRAAFALRAESDMLTLTAKDDIERIFGTEKAFMEFCAKENSLDEVEK